MLFHISETPGIACFEPREPATGGERVVWAVDRDHLRNYLLPRDCPRVTFYAHERSSDVDRATLVPGGKPVVVVEEAWIERIQQTTLYCYHFPPESFTCLDAGAGYYVSRTPVVAVRIERISNLLLTLAEFGVEVRVLANLWELHDAVTASSLQFSMIRMRNAVPRGR